MRRRIVFMMLGVLTFVSSVFPHQTVRVYKQVANKFDLYAQPNFLWYPAMAKMYARTVIKENYGWGRSEFKALDKLWTAESHWSPMAYNKKPGNLAGAKAGGIPQILNLDPKTPAPHQIERGLAYIKHRYGMPSVAWSHHRRYGWY